MTPRARLRSLGYLEGGSFLFLVLVAMPLKHWADWPLGVRWVGMAHGLLFLAYAFAIAGAVIDGRWALRTGLTAFAASFLPLGPFVFERRMRERER
jgi:integral membrane protein